MGGPGDFTAFVIAAEPDLLATAFLLTGSRPLATGAVETALVSVHRRWRRLGDPAAEARRSLVTGVLHGLGATQLVESVEVEVSAVDRSWLTALGALPVRTRAAVVLRLHDGLDDATIAQLLDCDAAAVAGLVEAGVRTLAALLPAEPAAEPAAEPPPPAADEDGYAIYRRPQ